MKILVTGCAGFIGFNVAKSLLDKKHTVVGIDSLNNYYPNKIKILRAKILKKYKNFIFIKSDISDKRKLDNIFKKYKFRDVFHFAAQPGVRRSVKYPKEYFDANITTFFNILECSKNYKINKILFASSSSVYGDNSNFPLKENSTRKPKNFYALSKCINEDMAKFYSKISRIKFIALRFFTIYGPYGRPDMLIWKMCENSIQNTKVKINNYGNHERDFTYIDDAIKMIMKIYKTKFKDYEIFNICSNNPVQLDKIMKIFDQYKINKKKKNIYFQKFQSGDVLKTHGSNLKLKKIIKNLKITNIKNGIKNTVNWYKNSYF